jgi:hypothetical protein
LRPRHCGHSTSAGRSGRPPNREAPDGELAHGERRARAGQPLDVREACSKPCAASRSRQLVELGPVRHRVRGRHSGDLTPARRLLTIEVAEQATVTPARAVREPSDEGLEELAPVGSELVTHSIVASPGRKVTIR